MEWRTWDTGAAWGVNTANGPFLMVAGGFEVVRRRFRVNAVDWGVETVGRREESVDQRAIVWSEEEERNWDVEGE